MPRPRLRRELCDCRDCVDGLAVQPLADEKHAAALLDPPPKCVVLFGSSFLALPTEGIVDDGITQATEPHSAAQGQPADSLDAAVCPHLDRLAQDGCSGFVAMHATAGMPPCGVEALQQLFGDSAGAKQTFASIADRFKQLHAVLVSNDDAAAAAGPAMGFLRALRLNAACCGQAMHEKQQQPASSLPSAEAVAAFVAVTLGALRWPSVADSQTCASEAETMEVLRAGLVMQPVLPAPLSMDSHNEAHDDDVDLLVIHVSEPACVSSSTSSGSHESQTSATEVAVQHGNPAPASAPVSGPSGVSSGRPGRHSNAFEHACVAIEWLDAVVMQLNLVPGFRDKVLLLVALGWGKDPSPPVLCAGGGQLSGLTEASAVPSGRVVDATAIGQSIRDSAFAGVRRPAQSYEVSAPANGAEHATLDPAMSLASPLLVVRRLPAVIRVDRCSQLGVAKCLRHSGDGAIASCHLLPELAFKLGRAPKYGA